MWGDGCCVSLSPVMAPSDLVLRRAAHLRVDSKLEARLAEPPTVLIPLWRSRVLIAHNEAALLTVGEAGSLVELAHTVVWLGLLGDVDCFALDLPPSGDTPSLPPLTNRGSFQDLRLAGSQLDHRQVELLAYARGLLYWHRHNRFCAECGGDTVAQKGGHVRRCGGGDREHFPRLDPAIMALVCHEGRCLLARQPAFPPGMLSALAGFVEVGESLEDAVRREVIEEVGLTVTEVRYIHSQPWPFPASLMLGFRCLVESDELKLDPQELEEARWLTSDEIRSPKDFFIPPPYSLAHHLIQAFLGD